MSIFETTETVKVSTLLGGDTIRWASRDWRVVNTPTVMHCNPSGNGLELTLYDGSINDPITVTALASDQCTKVNIDTDLLLALLGDS